jgi:hypothetical protein
MHQRVLVERTAAAQSRAAAAAKTIHKELGVTLPDEPAFVRDSDVRALQEREYTADVLEAIADAVKPKETVKESAAKSTKK